MQENCPKFNHLSSATNKTITVYQTFQENGVLYAVQNL